MKANSVMDKNENTTDDGEILFVAPDNFFSETLSGSLKKGFPKCSVSMISDIYDLKKDRFNNLNLLLFYQMTRPDLQTGLERARKQQLAPSVGLVVDTVETMDISYTRQLIDMRMIDGVLPLTLGVDVFMSGVELVLKGGEHFPSSLLRAMSADRDISERQTISQDAGKERNRKTSEQFSELTAREFQTLELLSRGLSNLEIGNVIGVAENTVKVFNRAIFKKIGAKNRNEAGAMFRSEG